MELTWSCRSLAEKKIFWANVEERQETANRPGGYVCCYITDSWLSSCNICLSCNRYFLDELLRIGHVTENLENADELGVALCGLQSKCKLSKLQTACVKDFFEKHTKRKIRHRAAEKALLAEAGVKRVVLHGCVGQHDDKFCHHIYRPGDRRSTCPICGHSRYSEDGKTPNETVFYFPIRPRLEALMRLRSFRELLQVSNCLCINVS